MTYRSLLARIAIALAFVVTAGRDGVAEPAADPEALVHQGVELRRKGEDTRAEGYFRRAYDIAPTSRTAAQLGLVELAVGKFVGADTHLTDALSSDDAWINEHRQALEKSRIVARSHLLRVEIVMAPRGTAVTSEGHDARPLPADGVLWLAPQRTTLRLEAPGYDPATVHVEGGAGATRRVVAQMPAVVEPPKAEPLAAPSVEPAPAPPIAHADTAPAAPEPSVASPGRNLRVAGVAVAAVGVATAIVGGVLYAKGVSERDDLRNAINSEGAIPYDPQDASWQSRRDTGGALLIGGGVAVVGGACLYALGWRAKNAEGAGTVVLTAGPGLGVFSYRGRF
jgi:hypothetical protein